MTVPRTTSARERGSEVQSVARAAALLDAVVSSGSGLTLTELAKRTELTVSTAHRLIRTLCSGNLLCRDATGDRFVPGPLLLRLGRQSLASAGLPEVGDVLADLAERTGETASAGLRRGANVLVLLAVQSSSALRFTGAAGAQVPLLSSGLGLAMLALADEPVAEVVAQAGVEGERADELSSELLTIQFRGFCVFDDPAQPGLRTIAAPVLGDETRPRIAVEITGPVSRMGDDRVDELGEAVRSAAILLQDLPVSIAFGAL
ncbi:IclR family transcriptional regulator [Amycolatopsis acidicola]|uniref:IclR family transcriptional regulator n=1 Tax=Amycolatopsis acidicola TaxID=2596893 RepID=UPI00140E4FB0|nr:IclR family transcriptional regulator [Amycolatopsis acidicola]